MELIINGERRQSAEKCTVSKLLSELELAQGQVAVERNGEIIPRSMHKKTLLNEGDRLEIVHFIGGG